METREITYAGLAADDSGTNDGRPPLVLLHGLTFDRSMWAPLRAELARTDPGRRVVAFDLPGHGASEQRPSYRLEAVVEDVRRAVEEADLGEPILVGHSIASGIATIYAGRYPVAGVVNVDGSLGVEAFAELVQSLAPRLYSDAFDEIWQTMFWPSMHAEVLPMAAQELVRATTRPVRELVLGYWQDLLETPPAELTRRIADCLAELEERGVPYLIVAGDELDDAYRRWLAARLPQATLTVMPGSGHFPHLAHPELFARSLEAFAAWSGAWSYVA